MRAFCICIFILFSLSTQAQDGSALDELYSRKCEAEFEGIKRDLSNKWADESVALDRKYGNSRFGENEYYYNTEKGRIDAKYSAAIKDVERQKRACIENARREWEDFKRQQRRVLEKKRIEEDRARIQAEKLKQERDRVARDNERIRKENELKKLEEQRQKREEARREAEERRQRIEEEMRRRRELAEQKAKNYNAQNKTNISNAYASSVKQGTEIAKNTIRGEVSNITEDYYSRNTSYKSNKLGEIFKQGVDDKQDKKQDELANLDELSEEDLSRLLERLETEHKALETEHETLEKRKQELTIQLQELKQANENAEDNKKLLQQQEDDLNNAQKKWDEESKEIKN